MKDRPKTPPRNVEDVDYKTLDGDVPMREVLEDRKRKHNAQNRGARDDAFRVRAQMIAQLQSCLCCYPTWTGYGSASGHADWCPADAMRRSSEAAKRWRDENSHAYVPLDELRRNATHVCSVCNAPQYATPSGTTCENGHGGAEGIPIIRVDAPLSNVDMSTSHDSVMFADAVAPVVEDDEAPPWER